MSDVIAKLRDKNDKAAYEYAKLLGIESSASDKYLSLIPEFADLLGDNNSYVRTRGFVLICNQARWANDGQIETVFNKMIPLLNDPKPTVVRQCLAALHEILQFRPKMADRIKAAVKDIDVSKYKDSMLPLIKKDIEALLKFI